MKLLTKGILKAFKKQGDTSNMSPEEIKIIVKFFGGCSASWYCYEYDEEGGYFWCFADLGNPDFAECGTVSKDELFNQKFPPFNLGLERDTCLGEHTLREVMDGARP